MVLGKPGIGYGGRNSLRQRTAPCFCRSRADNIRVTGARPLFRSGPYYRTGHRKSVKIRKKSYGWQLCTYTLPPQLHELCSVGAQLLGVYWNLLALLSPAVLWELCIEIPDRLCTHTHIYGLHPSLVPRPHPYGRRYSQVPRGGTTW